MNLLIWSLWNCEMLDISIFWSKVAMLWIFSEKCRIKVIKITQPMIHFIQFLRLLADTTSPKRTDYTATRKKKFRHKDRYTFFGSLNPSPMSVFLYQITFNVIWRSNQERWIKKSEKIHGYVFEGAQFEFEVGWPLRTHLQGHLKVKSREMG